MEAAPMEIISEILSQTPNIERITREKFYCAQKSNFVVVMGIFLILFYWAYWLFINYFFVTGYKNVSPDGLAFRLMGDLNKPEIRFKWRLWLNDRMENALVFFIFVCVWFDMQG